MISMVKYGVDRVGMEYGMLKIISKDNDRSHDGIIFWNCLCKCGNMTSVSASHLLTGHTRSCGCLTKRTGTDSPQYEHGYNGQDRIYRIWNNMRDRCYCKAASSYKRYGAKGITICDEWDNFLTFREWALKNGYSDNLTLDRIDNSGNYCPENCRWTDAKIQARNRSSNRMLEYNDEVKCMSDWAD